MTMRWVLEIRRAPSLTRLSRAVLDGRADNSQRLIEMDRTADPLTVRGDRRECRPIHTDRRGEVCGNRGATVVRPVCREGRAWRDCSSSRGWRNWWLTPAGLGCSTRARRESSRLKHWAYSWHPFADCSKREGPTISATRQARRRAWRDGPSNSSRNLPELDDVVSVEEVAGILGKPRRWIIQNAATLAVRDAGISEALRLFQDWTETMACDSAARAEGTMTDRSGTGGIAR